MATDGPVASISYLALSGGQVPTMLRFMGSVKGHSVQVLLDGGSTHNFIHSRMDKFLCLSIEDSFTSSVMVEDGNRLKCLGVVRQLSLIVQDYTLVDDFFIIEFARANIVLDVLWLAKLGCMVIDYGNKLFELQDQDKLITWIGHTGPMVEQVQFQAFRRLYSTNSIFYFFQLQLLPPTPPSSTTTTTTTTLDLTALLDTYTDIFSQSTSLPPSRPQDHCIPLILGTTPINVRPYHYSHF